MMLARSR